MARQGIPRHKVLSSGRLTGSSRGLPNKKKAAGRYVPSLEPAYSLYSTDSEDQVATVHKGLDRCAALLNGILQAERAESKTKSQAPRSGASKAKYKVVLGKVEAEQKRTGKKPSSVTNSAKRPAPVQKTVLSAQIIPGVRGEPCIQCVQQQPPAVNIAAGSAIKPTGSTPVTQVQHLQPNSLPLGCGVSGISSSLPATGQQTSAVFNCRLTTSTPALSPKSSTSAHSQTSHVGSDRETQHFAQQYAVGPSEQPTVSPAQYPASVLVAPAVQQQPVRAALSTVPPGANGELRLSNPHSDPSNVVSAGQSDPLPSHTGSQNCTTMRAALISPSNPQSLPKPDLVGTSPQEYGISSGQISEASGGCTSEEEEDEEEEEEEELDRVDTTPVRDMCCQTSMDRSLERLGIHKAKPLSPEKTARKVMTVKYLLGELKALLANQDSEVVRLISEVEQNISLLPVMVGGTNVQAELALALQPLRSENVQLRRRLRILNQQLQEREKAEKRRREMDCELELVSLQSLNLKLQTQLNGSHRELESLHLENKRLLQALEDKENEMQQSKEKLELETSRIRMDVNEALDKVKSSQAKLEDAEKERSAYTQILHQKESEITHLLEIIRNLQKSPTRDITCRLALTRVSTPPPELTQSVLGLFENQQQKTATSDRVSESVKTYLQTLECPSPGKQKSGEQNCGLRELKASSAESLDVHRSAQLKSASCGTGEGGQSGVTFVPLKETVTVQHAGIGSHLQVNGRIPAEGASGCVGLKYLDLAFEKLGISNGLPAQDVRALDDSRGRDFLLHADGVGGQLKRTNEGAANILEQSRNARRCLQMGEVSVYAENQSAFENTITPCDIKSLASDISLNSWSTFNTRDEQDFRNGLAALDASIASLQRTLKAEFKK